MALVQAEGDSLYDSEPIYWQFESTDEPNFKARIIQNSEGKNLNQAGELANRIHYDYALNANVLSLASVFSTPASDKYRGQNVQITVSVPQGKKVHIGQNVSWLSWMDEEDENKTFTMCGDGLKLKCRAERERSDESTDQEHDTLTEENF